MIRLLAVVACVLTVCITASSAFIRHSQASVGCEPWPACYREAAEAKTTKVSSPAATPALPTATPTSPTASPVATPDAPVATTSAVRIARALHRLSAMAVGILVLVVAAFGWSTMRGGTRVALVLALVDTFFLAWLGRLTPHELPLVTVGNLVGGIGLAASFAWIAAATPRRVASGGAAIHTPDVVERGRVRVAGTVPGVASMAGLALALLALSAWVGTMIGAHGAIDACATPLCFSDARLDLAALDPTRAAAMLDAESARGLHLVHRLLAVAFVVTTLVAAWRIRRRPTLAVALVVAAVAQWVLGVGTALGAQPLFTTTAHNATAAVLAVLLAAIASGSSGNETRASTQLAAA